MRWRKPTHLLADLLGCTALDLLGQPAVPAGSLNFPEFPALPPLRPEEELPRILRGGWLLERVRDADHDGVRAIVAGPGMGKSLVVRWLQLRAGSEFAAISTSTLAGVGELVGDPRILVVDIDERDPRTDTEALRTLMQRTQPAIVLAPFELPGVAKDKSPLVFDARARASLLGWIADRLDRSDRDTHLDLEEVGAWLKDNDPELRVVATPADLLAFCADVHAAGLDEATWEVRARRWLRATIRLCASEGTSPALPVEDIVDALCRATVTRREYPWGALPGDVWPTLVPEELRGPDASRWGRGLVVHGLRAAGLLRGAADGLTLAPSWVHHGLAAAEVDRTRAPMSTGGACSPLMSRASTWSTRRSTVAPTPASARLSAPSSANVTTERSACSPRGRRCSRRQPGACFWRDSRCRPRTCRPGIASQSIRSSASSTSRISATH